MKYQASDTRASDWLLLAAMLAASAIGVIGLVWFVAWLIFQAVKGG